MRINVDDDLYVELEKRAAIDMLPLDEWVEAQLQRVKEHSTRDRILIVGRDMRDALEAQLGGGSLQDDEDLVAKVERLAVLKIGELTTTFSPGQWEELARRCERAGVPIQDEAERIVRKVSELFFDHVGVV